MGHELIRTWLELPAGPWPPDHYTLLGLPQGTGDPARIERQVQERLERVRSFQLAHPEQATEAMNRLAQAFISLTDAVTKREYDAALDSAAPTPVATGAAPQQLDWQTSPPPPQVTPVLASEPAASTPTLQDTGTVETPPLVVNPPPAVHDPEQRWQPLLAILATKRALLDRILLVRQLLHIWRTSGKYLRRSERPLTKPAEATDLIQQMERVRKLLSALPGLLGEAGQSGYLVAALARQPLIVPTVQTLLPSQRAALARDWQNGLALLTAHLKWLRLELRARRTRNSFTRGLRAILLTLRDRPGLVLFAIGLVALNLLPFFRAFLFEQIVLLLGVLAFRLFLWWDVRKTVQNVRTTPERRPTRGRSARPASR